MSTTATSRPGPIASHRVDSSGRPRGGTTHGPGYHVSWRDTSRPSDTGACPADLIEAARDRLLYLQATPVANSASAEAIRHLGAALGALDAR